MGNSSDIFHCQIIGNWLAEWWANVIYIQQELPRKQRSFDERMGAAEKPNKYINK